MSFWQTDVFTQKLNAPQFDYGQYSSPRNTVNKVSSPIIQGKQPVIGDTFELSMPKSETKTVNKTPSKPKQTISTPSAKTKPMMFMGKMTNMTETIVKNDDGTMMKIYNDGENGTKIISFDKTGKPSCISEEFVNGDKYQKITISYNPDGTLDSEAIDKNLSTNASSEYKTHTDKNGLLLEESTIENKDGVERASITLFDDDGYPIKTSETITDDKTSTTITEEIDTETGNYTTQNSVYDIATSSETTKVEKTDPNDNLIYESDTHFKNGESVTEYKKYDKLGNVIGEGVQTIDKNGYTQNERVEYDASTGLYVEEKGSYDVEGVGIKTLVKTDKQGNIVSEYSNNRSNDGYTKQTYTEYGEGNQVVKESYMKTGKGSIYSQEAKLDEQGQVQTKTMMAVDGKVYDNQADFEEALKKK